MRALSRLVADGKVRSIGISNFYGRRLEEALDASEIPLVVNQVEFHPHLYQKELLKYCGMKNVLLTAYSPLARGKILDDEVLSEIGRRHGKSVPQVSLRWLVQHGITVIPKSSSERHLRENTDIFSWKLTKKEMDDIDSIKTADRLINPSFLELPLIDRIPKSVLKRIPDGVRKAFGRQMVRTD